jgi:hypothetical protein
VSKSFVFGVILLGLLFAAAAEAQPAGSFDHDLTRFPLTGKHETAACASCHIGGQFTGTPTSCQLCHSGAGARAETRLAVDHIPVRTDCDDCHTTRFWEPARMDHGTVGDNCASCHVGNLASSKPPGHIQSSNQCGDCHGTRSWEDAGFDHAGIVTNCISCHNGMKARGKDGNHIESSNDCELCHSTRRWIPAGFDHTGSTTNCISCHNGMKARGKDGNHIESSDDCELCHSTQRWIPAGFDHSGVTPGTCNTCHNGMRASGPPSGHFSTMLSCDACHTTQGWQPVSYSHTGNYPGDHRVSLTCKDCHGGNSAIVTWPYATYQPSCAACHANQYQPNEGEHRGKSVSENRDCGGSGCHSVRDRSFGD